MDKNQVNSFDFIDLFAGIGGFHTAMHSIGGKCVFASEWDKNARKTYEATYEKIDKELFEKDEHGEYLYFNCDINDAKIDKIPDFEVLCGGFPCQAFSIAGKRKGFEDARGTLFFNIQKIVQYRIDLEKENPNSGIKRPKVLFLENVKGLKNHDKGETLRVLKAILEDQLKYRVQIEVLNAKYFGVPQNRERLFFVCWDPEQIKVDTFHFPYGLDKEGRPIFDKAELCRCVKTRLGDIFEPKDSILPKYTISDRLWAGHQARKERNKRSGKGFGYSLFTEDSPYSSTISARYYKDGSEILIDQSAEGKNPRKLTPVEAGRLQGYRIQGAGWAVEGMEEKIDPNQPELVIDRVSNNEAYHQFGNSVAVPVIKTLAKEIQKQLLDKSE